MRGTRDVGLSRVTVFFVRRLRSGNNEFANTDIAILEARHEFSARRRGWKNPLSKRCTENRTSGQEPN
jgi:hypothetical protein